jgi:3-methylcrotonyl-CoA carboxylase beta subunit
MRLQIVLYPKITIIVGNSYGAGNYAMCGKAYDPRFIFAYPAAKISVMGGSQAANVLMDIRSKQFEKAGKVLDEETKLKMYDEIRDSYESKSSPLYAAARLWVDEVIDPAKTREYISRSIEAVNNNPFFEEFKLGVIQV